jgi:hypothetical protein
MGEESTEQKQTAAVVCDVHALAQTIQDGLCDQVRFVLTLDPKAPSIAFTMPDCGSEELGYKLRHMQAGVLAMTDLIFKWTTSDNYDVEEGEDHDPSIA